MFSPVPRRLVARCDFRWRYLQKISQSASSRCETGRDSENAFMLKLDDIGAWREQCDWMGTASACILLRHGWTRHCVQVILTFEDHRTSLTVAYSRFADKVGRNIFA